MNDLALHPRYYLVEAAAGGGMLGVAIEIALEILGIELRALAYIEREASAAAVLVARMEDKTLGRAPVWDDVDTATSDEFLEVVEGFRPLIVCAGYPCQPFSKAGKRAGERDPRHLWPAIDRLVGALMPELLFFENVPGHLRLGFGEVRRNLEARGYGVAAGLFSANEVGASQERERLFILAALEDGAGERQRRGRDGDKAGSERRQEPGALRQRESENIRSGSDVADARDIDRGTTPDIETRAERSEFLQHGDWSQSPVRVGDGGEDVARSGAEGLEGTGEGECHTGDRRVAQGGPSSELCGARVGAELPLFPPGRFEFAEWERILRSEPSYVEPSVPRLADGLAAGLDTDRTRVSGNGVVTLAASYAFLSLLAVIATRSVEREEPVTA